MNITASLKYYNANPGNRNVQDCVKRSLSLAYGMDYSDVSRELNRIKRDQGAYAFNSRSVFTKFMKIHGCEKLPQFDGTTAQFCDMHPTGTYILLVNSLHRKDQTWSDHMCCVIDGDLYDSWDSLNADVLESFKISEATTEFTNVEASAVWHEIEYDVEAYLGVLSDKQPYADLGITGTRAINTYAFRIDVTAYFDKDAVPSYSAYSDRSHIRHTFVIKTDPKYTMDQVPNTFKKVKQAIYDWWYMIAKEIKDTEAAMSLEVNPKFRGEIVDLMKLPEWSRSLVTRFYIDPYGTGGDMYLVYMDNLPGDPRADECADVDFRGDTLTELKYNMEQYRKSFKRFGYDY